VSTNIQNSVQIIKPEVRDVGVNAAISLDIPNPSANGKERKPGEPRAPKDFTAEEEDYNRRGDDHEDLLNEIGTYSHTTKIDGVPVQQWTRIGKEGGTSFTHGDGWIHVFTSSMDHLEQNETYAMAEVLAIVRHDGDREKSQAELKALGYGPGKPADYFQKELMWQYEHKIITDRTEVPEPFPVISIAGQTVSTACGITVFSGHSKTGKSAIVGGPILAGCLSDQALDPFPDIQVAPSKGGAIIYIDTEQSPSKLSKTVKGIVRRSGLPTAPDYFYPCTFLGDSIKEAWETLENICRDAAEERGSIHLVVIDGCADFDPDTNDSKTSKETVRRFQNLAVRYNCPITTVIHLNPNANANRDSDKERGHLGSELQRKCESLLRIKSEKGVSSLEAILLRNGDPTQIPIIQFKFNPLEGYHVFTGHKEGKEKDSAKEFETWAKLAIPGEEALTHGELLVMVMKVTNKAFSTCKKYIKAMTEMGFFQHVEGKYRRPVDPNIKYPD